MDQAEPFNLLETSWDLADTPVESPHGRADLDSAAVATARTLHTSTDQRQLAQQDKGFLSLPSWPPKDMDRAPGTREEMAVARREHRRKRARRVHFEDTPILEPRVHRRASERHRRVQHRPPVEDTRLPSLPSDEPTGQRISRCMNGVVRDFIHWDSIEPPDGKGRLAYVLTRDQRAPVVAWSLILTATIVFLLVLLLSTLCSSPYQPLMQRTRRLTARQRVELAARVLAGE